MSDVFLSYAREDRDRARVLVGALELHGWSVFWDRAIPAGKTFHAVLEEAIRQARCVIVLWSPVSVESDWVVDEAELGRTAGTLIPVLLEPVRVPLMFRRIQSVDLAEWRGDSEDPLLSPLIDAVTHLAGPRKAPKEFVKPIVKPGNVFVSYAKEDLQYVQDLTAFLRNSGLPVWADDRIDFGDRWWRTIVANIRNCVAMVVVMTPSSEDSKWVEREVLLADKLEKPIFPLLLTGECFPMLITFEYHDVTSRSMPPTSFVTTLTRLTRAETTGPVTAPRQAAKARAADQRADQQNPNGGGLIGIFRRLFKGSPHASN